VFRDGMIDATLRTMIDDVLPSPSKLSRFGG